jgi:hypothetical protein
MTLLFFGPCTMNSHCIISLQIQYNASIATVARCVQACSSPPPPRHAASAVAIAVAATAALAALWQWSLVTHVPKDKQIENTWEKKVCHNAGGCCWTFNQKDLAEETPFA